MSDAFTWHGGRLEDARRLYGEGPLPWLDLSTGINPAPWPGAQTLSPDWQSLPDPSSLAALEAVAARYFEVDPALCCAVPGSEIGLRLLGTVIDMAGRYRDPSYRTHAEIFDDSAAVSFRPDDGSPTALVLANPNNPDGTVLAGSILHAWLSAQEAADGWLIVDEAFVDTCPEQSMAATVAANRRLIVMRSFGKFFGLAGVRLGFAIAPPPIIDALRRRLGDWPLTHAAIEIGRSAYADRRWIEDTRAALKMRAGRFDTMLARRGLPPFGKSPLFRLIESPRAPELFDQLARNQILTRPFGNRPGWLRFGVPESDEDIERVERALTDA